MGVFDDVRNEIQSKGPAAQQNVAKAKISPEEVNRVEIMGLAALTNQAHICS